ncbi:MAG: glycine cleavage system protein H [Bacteriovoracia bacterium]
MKPLTEFKEGLLWRIEEGESLFLVGVTQEALDSAGTIQALDLSDVGDEFEEGDWIGEIQGKNSLVEITAPFSLRIVESNREIREQPGLIEDDPTGDAWILRVERINGD